MPALQRPSIARKAGGHWYILNFEADERCARLAMVQVDIWAADPRHAFDWSDAAVMIDQIRRLVKC